ncbi:uncharacterized protein LOC116350112 [Contarinia nasturtii]|uniref:uncharacterized protein LOC116350112 n=1 Tax=Contarinia nasturtii TaxID=265458 RepID=UPI0012D378AD|nr:uncharacterized protein LOC116350112 [Contarinia nasturtii]
MSLLLNRTIYKPKSNVICVSPMPCEFYYNQHAVFEKFGKLRFVGIDIRKSEDHSIVGFVEFEEEYNSVAENLLSKGYMEIEDKKYRVKSYNDYIQDSKQVFTTILKLDDTEDDPLLQPPDQDSPKHILNVLNDDCLFAFFERLHFSTLISVAKVCIRFNGIAKKAFSSKYKFGKINILDLEWNRQPTLSQVKRFLNEFGSSITSLSLLKRSVGRYTRRGIKDTGILLEMINKYCKSLNELEFESLEVHEQTLYEIRGLFERLEILRVHNLKTASIFDIISVCSELKILDLHFFSDIRDDGYFVLPNTIHPKLIEVNMRFPSKDAHLYSKAIQRFTELNSKLKILKLWLAFKLVMTNLSKLNELNEFEIILEYSNFPTLIMKTLSSPNVQIENLKLFIANWPSGSLEHDLIETLSKFPNLTEIRIRFVHSLISDVLILLLKKLPNMKTLSFNLYRLKDFNVISKNECFIIKSILQHANQLSKLTFMTENAHFPFDRYPISNAEYYDILKSVENRRNGIKLTIEFLFCGDLETEYTDQSQSILILNMVPHLLTIHQRTNYKMYNYAIQ